MPITLLESMSYPSIQLEYCLIWTLRKHNLDQGCGHPWTWVSATGASGFSASATGARGGFSLQPLGYKYCVSWKPATEGTRASEEDKGHSTDSWSRTVGHSPCAWLWLMAGGESLSIFPKSIVHGVCLCIY